MMLSDAIMICVLWACERDPDLVIMVIPQDGSYLPLLEMENLGPRGHWLQEQLLGTCSKVSSEGEPSSRVSYTRDRWQPRPRGRLVCRRYQSISPMRSPGMAHAQRSATQNRLGDSPFTEEGWLLPLPAGAVQNRSAHPYPYRPADTPRWQKTAPADQCALDYGLRQRIPYAAAAGRPWRHWIAFR